MHDPDYRAAQKDWASFVESVTQKVIDIDDTIPELPVKDIVRESDSIRDSTMLTFLKVFRIYRDIRFSSDPTPYKVRYAGSTGSSKVANLFSDSLLSGMVSDGKKRSICYILCADQTEWWKPRR